MREVLKVLEVSPVVEAKRRRRRRGAGGVRFRLGRHVGGRHSTADERAGDDLLRVPGEEGRGRLVVRQLAGLLVR